MLKRKKREGRKEREGEQRERIILKLKQHGTITHTAALSITELRRQCSDSHLKPCSPSSPPLFPASVGSKCGHTDNENRLTKE